MNKRSDMQKNTRRWMKGLVFVGASTLSVGLYAVSTNYFFLSMGSGMSRLTNSVNVLMDQYGTTNSYHTNQQRNWGVVSGAGLETIYPLGNHFNVTLGPALYYADLSTVRGLEYPNSDSGVFDTLNYQFDAHAVMAVLESRLIWTSHAWQPMLVAGIGNAWNMLSRYSEVPTDPNGSAAAAFNVFRNYTMCHFAFELGAGIQRHLYTSSRYHVSYHAALEYRYLNFGAGKLNQSIDQVSNQYLRVQTLDQQALMVTLSASFD